MGLTGGIGAGKSEVSRLLVEQGAVLLQLSSPAAVARLRQAQDAAAAASTGDDVQLPSVDLGPLQDAADAAAEASVDAGRAAAAPRTPGRC